MIDVKTLVEDLETALKDDSVSLEERHGALEKAKKAYENLGDTWREELDQSVYGGSETTDPDGDIWSHNERYPLRFRMVPLRQMASPRVKQKLRRRPF